MFARDSFAAHFAVCHCRGDATPMARLSYALEDFALGARFLWRLPAFLRHPVSPEQALTILRRRLAQREADFLALMRQAVYGRAGRSSPYRKLLGLAGCEYGDL